MKNKCTRLLLAVLVALLGLISGGCGEEEETGSSFVYYLNKDITKVTAMDYEPQGTEAEELIEEYLQMLQEQPDSAELVRTIPESVQILGTSMRSVTLTIDFSEEYYAMGTTQEVLVRAAIVRTLVQISGVSYVSFTVNGQSLNNSLGELVGSMNADSFVENPGEQINSSIEANLTLYFVNSDGTALVKETRTVHYSSNISLEKLVIDQLTEGPKDSSLKSTLSTDTKLITISVVDGICYVNFDDTISSSNTDINEELLLYSIVNSLTELSTVDKVQISINGSTDGKLRYTCDLSTLYEANYSYMEAEVSSEE
ncbi:MAG: GerMN domain-containing protein [Clostridiales bacterium]|nr:GerMN domain-containing protein [Clostridiales bacterium]